MSTEPDLTVEEIWREVGGALRGFVRRHVADPDAADDLVADVMLRIHQHLGQLDDRERVTAWVFRIARNAITDHYRRRGRSREVLDDRADDRSDAQAADSGADAWLDDPAVALAELAACIRPLVNALPDDYRRALELTDLEGRTQAEAARLEGISVSGMKSRVQRGRRQFAALVSQCCHLTTDARGEVIDFVLRDDGCGCDPAGQSSAGSQPQSQPQHPEAASHPTASSDGASASTV